MPNADPVIWDPSTHAYIQQSAARAFVDISAGNTIPDDGAFHTLTYENVYANYAGVYNSDTPTRFYAPYDCLVLVAITNWFATDSDGVRSCQLLRSDSQVLLPQTDPPTVGAPTVQNICGMTTLMAGQYLEVQVKQNSGASMELPYNSMGVFILAPLGPIQ